MRAEPFAGAGTGKLAVGAATSRNGRRTEDVGSWLQEQ
jgi:hypothetical protein